MALSVTHSTVVVVADDGTSPVGTDEWNDDHTITGLGAGVETFLGTPSSVNLLAAITNETGTGALVFADTPTLVTPVLGVATATSLAASGLITTSLNGALSAPGITGTGTWISTGGTGTTTKPYVLIEPAGTTSTGWSVIGTGVGVNSVSGFVGNLLDLQSNGTTFFSVSASTGGATLLGQFNGGSNINLASDTGRLRFGASNDVLLTRGGAAATLRLGDASSASAAIAQTLTVQGSSGASAAAALFTVAASDQSGTTTIGGELRLRGGNGTSAGGAITFYTSATTTPSLALKIYENQQAEFSMGTVSRPSIVFSAINSTGIWSIGSANISFSIAAVEKMRLVSDGTLAIPNGIRFGGTVGVLTAQISSSGAGIVALGNDGTTGFARLQFGGTTSSFPALKRSTTTLIVTGGDDSAVGGLTVNGPTQGLGYSTGAGGSVSQATDRTTGVTLNKTTGQITTQATSLAALGIVTFTVTNSAVAATDNIILSKVSGDIDTSAWVSAVAAGSFNISLRNNDAVSADTTAYVTNFAVIKGVTS